MQVGIGVGAPAEKPPYTVTFADVDARLALAAGVRQGLQGQVGPGRR